MLGGERLSEAHSPPFESMQTAGDAEVMEESAMSVPDVRGWERRSVLAAGIGLAGSTVGLASAAWADEAAVARTRQGALRGKKVGNVFQFRGVRYAEPQTPANRFRPPVPLRNWRGVRDALVDGNVAIQPPGGPRRMAGPYRVQQSLSEDCLFVNVFTPALHDGGRRPVMFWCHGGAYTTGSGILPPFDGSNLAAYGNVVVVTVTHRLGPLGFLYLPEAGPGFADAGNAGMLDIVEALRWVRDNAAAFGGDPNNVTIFGESGGGAKVSVLLGMPSASGLIHKAIVQSGSSVQQRTPERASAATTRLLRELGIAPGDAQQLRSLSAERIQKAATDANVDSGPVVDGRSLPHHSFDPEATVWARSIPMIIGTNRTEESYWASADLFEMNDSILRRMIGERLGPASAAAIDTYRSFYPSFSSGDIYFQMMSDIRFRGRAIQQAERKSRQAQQGGAPVFMYYLTWPSPIENGRWMSFHTLDIPFVFRNHRAKMFEDVLGFGAEQDRLADKMSAAWVAFARTGNPSNATTGSWKPYDTQSRSTMVFGHEALLVDDPNGANRPLFVGLADRQTSL